MHNESLVKRLIQIYGERVRFFYNDWQEEKLQQILGGRKSLIGKTINDNCNLKICQNDSLNAEDDEQPILESWNGLYRDDWDD